MFHILLGEVPLIILWLSYCETDPKIDGKSYYRSEQRECGGTAGINSPAAEAAAPTSSSCSIQNVTVYNLKADHLNSNHFYQIEIVSSTAM